MKLISLIVAAMFVAVSGSALAAAHAGAGKGDKKMEATSKAKGEAKKGEPKKAAPKKKAAAKTDKMDKK